MIEIDKNVPLPRSGAGSGRKPKYPWHEMEVGDSFLCDLKLTNASSQACVVGKRFGRKFSCRNVPEGVRVWRTE